MIGFKIEGIILKRKNFGEADRILTVFSLQKGKISVLAKGVKKITSRRSGNVELLNRSLMYLHQAKTFFILTEAETLDTFPKIKMDLTLSTYAYHIIELVDKLTAENQENRTLYNLLTAVLEKIENNPRQIFIRSFEVKILSNLGFWSNDQVVEISDDLRKLLKLLEVAPWDEIEKIKMTANQAIELEGIMRYYLERVIEGSLKSRKFLKDIYG